MKILCQEVAVRRWRTFIGKFRPPKADSYQFLHTLVSVVPLALVRRFDTDYYHTVVPTA